MLTASLRPVRHVGLIQIQGKEFEFKPIRLRSVRPFIFEDLVLSTYHDKQTDDRKKLNSKVAVNKYLKAKVSFRLGFGMNGLLTRDECTGQRAHRPCEPRVG